MAFGGVGRIIHGCANWELGAHWDLQSLKPLALSEVLHDSVSGVFR